MRTTWLLPLLVVLALAGPPPAVRLERVGRLDHPAIREASGLVRSRRHPGIYWTHNDSGNPPALFAVRRDGSLVREYRLNVANVDWEDIAADDEGHLYLGDIGNNGGTLPLRAVYRLDEPDPTRGGDGVGALTVRSASFYRFPPGGRFDAEGLFVEGGKAMVVAKTFGGRDAEVYAVPLDPPASVLAPAVAERVGALAGFTEPATGASLSADGRRLAVCSLRTVGVYRKSDRGGWEPVALRSFDADDQVEAVTWDGDDLLLAGEKRGLYRIPADALNGPAAGTR